MKRFSVLICLLLVVVFLKADEDTKPKKKIPIVKPKPKV